MPDSAIKNAKDMMFSDTSLDGYLSLLGGNYGVPRPSADPGNDDLYRQFIQLLAAQPKMTMRLVYQMLEVLFGSQADLVAAGQRPWRVYEPRPNVLLVEIPYALTPSYPPYNATFLHGFGGDEGYTGVAPTTTFYVRSYENMNVKANSSLMGYFLRTFGPGSAPGGDLHQISGVTYDPLTGVNTISVTPAGTFLTQQTGVRWSIMVPSGGSFSFDGNYMLNDPTAPKSQVNDQPVVLWGPAKAEIFQQYMLQLVKAAGVKLEVVQVTNEYVPGVPFPS